MSKFLTVAAMAVYLIFLLLEQVNAYPIPASEGYLTGIPPTGRGVPQIEVTFDLDANGIMKVSANDFGTGNSQSLTIQSSNASPSNEEIKKLIAGVQKIENLTGIPPTGRGVPQIEVTFDIDANGIIKVSAGNIGASGS